MTTGQLIVMVGAGVVATMLTRFIPFLVFRPGKPTPKMVQYLGRVFPASVFALLVVYCLKDVVRVDVKSWMVDGCSFFQHVSFASDVVPQLVSVAVTIGVHVWRKNMMVSIAVGTICYMALVRFM